MHTAVGGKPIMITIKKIFIAFIILPFVFSKARAQTSFRFKAAFIPGNTYTQSMNMTATTKSLYIADSSFLDKQKEKGIKNPRVSKSKSYFESISIVSKLDSGKYFIVTEILNGNSSVPKGTKSFGHGQIGSLPTFDSILMTSIYSNEYKDNVLSTLQSVFNQVVFPDKTIKVGEDFLVKNSLQIPIANDTIPIEIITTYKLLEVSENIAKFSIKQTYETDLNYITPADIKGHGNGYLNFDIKNKCYKEYGIKSDMNLEFKHEKFTFQTSTNSTTTIFFKISKQ